MPELSDFRLGADVIDSAGHKAGTLISVIVDENGFDPRALVVKDEVSLARRLLAGEKLFTTDEVVIPITAVESASHEAVRRRGALDRWPRIAESGRDREQGGRRDRDRRW